MTELGLDPLSPQTARESLMHLPSRESTQRWSVPESTRIPMTGSATSADSFIVGRRLTCLLSILSFVRTRRSEHGMPHRVVFR